MIAGYRVALNRSISDGRDRVVVGEDAVILYGPPVADITVVNEPEIAFLGVNCPTRKDYDDRFIFYAGGVVVVVGSSYVTTVIDDPIVHDSPIGEKAGVHEDTGIVGDEAAM